MYEDVVLRGFHTLTQDVLKSDVYTSSSYLSILALITTQTDEALILKNYLFVRSPNLVSVIYKYIIKIINTRESKGKSL